MSKTPNPDELELSDAELIEVLKNHGIDRRVLMKAFGAGAIVTGLGGTAAAKPGNSASRIDEVFGAPYSADDKVPSGLVDHEVELRVLAPGTGPNQHDDFPVPEPGDDPNNPDDDDPGDDEQSEFFFDPVGLHVKPGDVVHFNVVEDHEHTVTSFAPKYGGGLLPRRIPDDASPFTAPPIVGDESWAYRFETTGVYDILCLPHVPFGMVARIVVFDPKKDDPGDLTDWDTLPNPPGPGDPLKNAETVLTQSELNPMNIVGEPDGEVAWADLTL